MKKTLLIIYSSLLCLTIGAQSLELQSILSLGDDLTSTSSGISQDITLGEIATETLVKNGNILSQGFHQLFQIIVSADEIEKGDFNVRLFPNPTLDHITLDTESKEQDYNIQIISQAGVVVHEDDFPGNSKHIQLDHLIAGQYFLIITDDRHHLIEQLSFQKLN